MHCILGLHVLISACIYIASSLCSAGHGVLRHPLGLAFNASAGLLYIAELDSHRIAVMDPTTGTVLRTIGSGVGQLNGPFGIALDGWGNLLVVDHWKNRIFVFNAHSGTPIASFPTLPKPYSVFVDASASGKVVVGGQNFLCMW